MIYQIGDRVHWQWKGVSNTWQGTGVVIGSWYWQPGFSSPAEMYKIKNDDGAFPFIDLGNTLEFGSVKDPTIFEFIYGALRSAE